jgi:hypothetical protein
MAEVDEEERRRQRNELFAKYYGLGADESADGHAAPVGNESFIGSAGSFGQPPKPEDELNLDSIHFSPEKYVSKLLKERSLKGLMQLGTENTSKAKELDGELQGLVYDNYNRFISATETIRKMRDNVVRMDEKLHTLEKNIDAVDALTQTLHTKLQKGRDTIEQKVAISRMMKQIQFLVELPIRLRKCLQEGSYAVGAKYWAAGDNILHRHNNIASFRQILEESRAVALELQTVVLDRIRHTSMEGKQSLRETNELFDTLRALRQTSLGAGSTATDENKLLMDPIQSRFEEDTKAIFKGIQAEFAYRMSTPPTILRLASKRNTRELLDAVVNALLTFHTQMNRAGEMFARGNKEIPVMVRRTLFSTMTTALDIISKSTEQQTIFRLEHGLCKVDATLPTSCTVAQEAVELFVFDVRSLVRPFREMAFMYLGEGAQDFIATVERAVTSVVSAVTTWITGFVPTIKTNTSANAALLLSAFCYAMSAYGTHELSTDGIDMTRPKQTFGNLAQRLTQQFIITKGQYFTSVIRKGLDGTNWAQAPAPKAVSPHCITLGAELIACKAVITNCIKDDVASKDPSKGKQSSTTASKMSSRLSQDSNGSSRKSSNVPSYMRTDTSSLASMDRIFTAPHTSTFSARVVNIEAAGVFEVCLLYIFKSFTECVRVKTLGKFGFHQMQVDVGYLTSLGNQRKWLKAAPVQELLSEVLKSAFDRCLERAALEPDAVNALVSPTLPEQKEEVVAATPTST